MSSCRGENLKISLFGQSHGSAVGIVADGFPAGFRPDMEAIAAFMRRRAPGHGAFASPRSESDTVEFISGLSDGVLCGAPLCAVIRNEDARGADYAQLSDLPRPGHADFTAQAKFRGFQDSSGGGHFSARLTAPLCAVGAICIQLLEAEGIFVGAHIESIGGVHDRRLDPVHVCADELVSARERPLTVLDDAAGEEMARVIADAAGCGDSVGGVIECAVLGLDAGIGDPIFGGLESVISSIVFAVPAVKGIEFGSGFACGNMRGSEHNDAFILRDGVTVTETNNHGGILGGISSGMPIVFRAAVKPTPSIAVRQRTVSYHGVETELELSGGRHDACIVPRAVPCIEAAAAIAVYDAFLGAVRYR